jgi:hypothetical protein
MQHNTSSTSFTRHEQSLISKIRTLPQEKLHEVEDFIDFLQQYCRDRQLTHAATKLSEHAFQQAWDNPEDAEYDKL